MSIFRANIPQKKAQINPEIRYDGLRLQEESSLNSAKKANKITGIAIKKDKLNACRASNPLLNNPVMVIPDLDMPGKIETPCKMPKIKESLSVIL